MIRNLAFLQHRSKGGALWGSVEPAFACVSLTIKNNLSGPPLNFQGKIELQFSLIITSCLVYFWKKNHTHTYTRTRARTHTHGICLSLFELLINPVLIHLPTCALLFSLSLSSNCSTGWGIWRANTFILFPAIKIGITLQERKLNLQLSLVHVINY